MYGTYTEFYKVYYDNQTDSWERMRRIPRMKKRLDEEIDNIHAFIRFYRWLLG